jgi:DNA-binding CsgD family transcriptional regulator
LPFIGVLILSLDRKPIQTQEKIAMTPTEKRIKRLWLAGKTSHEIAAEIGLNERMVQAILDDLGL